MKNFLKKATYQDSQDPTAKFRNELMTPTSVLYFCGHSLGPLPRKAVEHIRYALESECGQLLIDGWNDAKWITLPENLGDKIARLIGASKGEVVVCDSTTINLYKSIHAALKLNKKRHKVIVEKNNFPADLYIAQAVADSRPNTLIKYIEADQIPSAIDSDTAAIVFSHVDYRTSKIIDIKKITSLAKKHSAFTVADLAHSAGVIPVNANDNQIDFAVGCTYKYLGGGPGSPAFIYVRKDLQGLTTPIFQGWMGHKNPFKFESKYVASRNIREQLCGTPPIISMKCLETALNQIEEFTIQQIHEKSQQLSQFFLDIIEQYCQDLKLLSPHDKNLRGSHLAYYHPQAYPITQALKAVNVVADYREPDCIRFGFSPLLNSFSDVFNAADRLINILETKKYKDSKFQTKKVVT